MLWADTALSTTYRWWKRVTPDDWEPYVRTGVFLVVAYSILATFFIVDVAKRPDRYCSQPFGILWKAPEGVDDPGSEDHLRYLLGQKTNELERWQAYALELEKRSEALQRTVWMQGEQIAEFSELRPAPKAKPKRKVRRKYRRNSKRVRRPALNTNNITTRNLGG